MKEKSLRDHLDQKYGSLGESPQRNDFHRQSYIVRFKWINKHQRKGLGRWWARFRTNFKKKSRHYLLEHQKIEQGLERFIGLETTVIESKDTLCTLILEGKPYTAYSFLGKHIPKGTRVRIRDLYMNNPVVQEIQ